ncbi:MAG TPA: hypothetical protein VKK31_02285 [Thermoanaerobaculia bacterium]|nr:hypothetical protein [Thermoanaerobaculia bacterium]
MSLFETVETVLTSSIENLARFREEPKTRLARESIELFDLLGKMRQRSDRVSELIRRCETAETTEGKVYFVFEAGKVLQILGELCGQLLYWSLREERTIQLSKLLAPEIRQRVHRIIYYESMDAEEAAGYPVPSDIEKCRESLEAVAHPDPRRLPNPERLRQARERFQSLAASCAGFQAGIRDFARDALTVDDFF